MSGDESLCQNFVKLDEPISVQVGNGSVLNVTSVGDIVVNLLLPKNKVKECTLKNVLFVPNLAFNVLSVSKMTNDKKTIIFENNQCKILDKFDKLIAVSHRVEKLYYLSTVKHIAGVSVNASNSNMLWHRRFGHLGKDNFNKMIRNESVKGLNHKIKAIEDVCSHCCNGKIHKCPFPISESVDHKPLDLIHSDVCGKIEPISRGNNSYFLTFIDHATRYTWVYVIANKSEVFETFVKWKVMVEKQYERKVKIIRTDNGGEYTSNEFESFLSNEGIVHQKTIPKTPEQNGVAERFNRTIMETVRCLLSDSELEEEFWAEALMTATYIRNRCINSFLGNITPFEALNNKKPSVKHFRVFGCTAYAHIPRDERSKLNKKARLCKLVGYGNVVKGY